MFQLIRRRVIRCLPGGRQILGCMMATLVPYAAGCSSSDAQPSSSVPDSGSATPDADVDPIGQMSESPMSCAEPHSVCIGAQMPAQLEGAPTLLRITLYKSVPPTTPPDGVAGMFPAPTVTAGKTAYLHLSDANLTGDFFIVGALYMPGGGTVIPVTGVDYASFSTKPYKLDGSGLTTSDILTFQK